jgi:hypothetical protein
MKAFELVSDLKFGHIVEVSGTTVRAELEGSVSELTRSYGGRIYPIGQIGSVVKIHFGRRLVFGFVTLLRIRSEEQEDGRLRTPVDTDQRLMGVELFAEGSWVSGEERLNLTCGVTTYPLPHQGVYLLTREEAGILYRAAEGQRPEGTDPLVPFATYVGAEAVPCRANIDSMFGMHCAVLGSTGSGKSGAVAALLHSMLDHRPTEDASCRPCIVVLDPHGEYSSAFGGRAIVYRAYDPISTDESAGETIRLPYWLMSAEEFRSLMIGKTEFEATSQHNVVYKALTHARMVAAGLVDAAPTDFGAPIPNNGRPIDARRGKNGVTPEQINPFDRDKPRPFSLDELVNHIEYLQAARPGNNGATAPISPSEYGKSFKSILDKLSVLRHDPRTHFLMENWADGSPSLSEILAQLVGEGASLPARIRIKDLSEQQLPRSSSIPFAAGWSGSRLTQAEIVDIARRMDGSSEQDA